MVPKTISNMVLLYSAFFWRSMDISEYVMNVWNWRKMSRSSFLKLKPKRIFFKYLKRQHNLVILKDKLMLSVLVFKFDLFEFLELLANARLMPWLLKFSEFHDKFLCKYKVMYSILRTFASESHNSMHHIFKIQKFQSNYQ